MSSMNEKMRPSAIDACLIEEEIRSKLDDDAPGVATDSVTHMKSN